MKPVQVKTRILGEGGNTTYAAGFLGVWLTVSVREAGGLRVPVTIHAPFAIVEPGDDDGFVARGEPADDCRLCGPTCWTVQHLGVHASIELIEPSPDGKPGQLDFDSVVLQRLKELVPEALSEARSMRPTWRVRLARRVRKWALR